ncbi:Phosphotransferase system, mannose/fructose/N-acetylgalactosamine [Elusimicrobium minutum Pei191]|uniref:Phosphotransferase system, mannose/fructose/N-acetylgalactosamine n=1 Tax=Elusimicrobium minutum (strain Pei191) TaxID=445932 RepID=B2KB00_ELUMP|nr:HPr family phosphocarrier protein [Elusimicrobium minutum]ACC97696.1 Phosphotransferase system, mannose/fructose/N-acetylgalactosamine [Elusimicrobium minutum Pei191]
MITRDIQIKNKMGLHARPAAMLAQTAGKFAADIKITKSGVEVNAKSIMGIMMLAAEYGSILTVAIDGSDENEALNAILNLFENNFSEAY